MKVNLTSIFGFIIIALAGVVFLQYQHIDKLSQKRDIVVPVTVPATHGAIPLPSTAIPKKEYIYVPKIVGVDSTLLNKYVTENDSLKKQLMYRDAITIREYHETFEDEYVKIGVKSRVLGKQLGLSIDSYTLKERDIDGTIPNKRDIDLFVGAELGVPTLPYYTFLVKVNLELEIEKLKYTLGYDTERRVWGGLSYKLL